MSKLSKSEIAIEVLENEKTCIKRQVGEGCDRNCALCDLVREDREILSAYDYTISLLKKQPEYEKKIEKVMDRCFEERNESNGLDGYEWENGYEAGKYNIAQSILEILEGTDEKQI